MGLGMAQGAAKAGGLKDFYKREVYMLKETYKRTLDLSKKTFERDILTEHGNGSGYGAGCCQGSVCTRGGSRNTKKITPKMRISHKSVGIPKLSTGPCSLRN